MVDARKYHEQTKHSPVSVRQASRLDPSTKPRPFKQYANRPRIELPDVQSIDEPILSAIATSDPIPPTQDREPIDLDQLSTLCYHASGITKELTIQSQKMRFRAAACTGKLYHIDLYPVIGDIPGLDAGVYHYDPTGPALDVVRTGDYRNVLAAAADDDAIVQAPVTVVMTSEWWRNAWKYSERTYRHAFWDSGTILANLLAAAHGSGHRAAVVTGFVDDRVARLLGVYPDTEAPIELVPIGSKASESDPPSTADEELASINPELVPVSSDSVDYPIVPDAWRQSTLPDREAVADWGDRITTADTEDLGRHESGNGERIQLDPVDAETASARPVTATIKRRGSLREFAHEPISSRLFATVLDRALRPLPITEGAPDTASERFPRLTNVYCLVHAVEGLDSGAYQYFPQSNHLERIGDTDRETAGHLALDQPVVGDAAVNAYLLADVDKVIKVLGNRGYRLAQLEGGISLGRLYLATYAHRAIGGRGFTFYDERVTAHLSPRAESQTPMTLFAFGRPQG